MTALIGANGAGKSTLVKVLCGVHSANGGSIRLFGEAFTPSSPAEAIKAMLGHTMSEIDLDIPTPGAPVLRLKDMELIPEAKPFSLDLHAGEVVAVTGLVGSGKSALVEVIFGLAKPASGEMQLRDAPYAPRDQAAAIATGVFQAPKDRASNAVIQGFDITKNITLPFTARHSHFGRLSRQSERKTAERMVQELGVVCQHVTDDIGSLPGGNQQKVMVARWMAEAANVLVLDEPFQGVDIKARRDIGAKIRATAEGRATVVMVAEMDEAVEIADRIVVMADHTLKGDHRNENIDLNLVLAQVAGSSKTSGQANAG